MTPVVLTLDDFELAGRTALLRVDINSPVDRQTKVIKDDTRIRRCRPTIRELAERGARSVILAHQGDPLDYHNFTPLAQHAEVLSRLLGRPVVYLDDIAGPAARQHIRGLHDGEILLLENVRSHTKETILFEEEVPLGPAQQAQTYVVRNPAQLAFLEKKNLLEFVEPARQLLRIYGDRLHHPLDVAILEGGAREELSCRALPARALIVDIGQRTVDEYSTRIASAGTIFVNGPAGVHEDDASALGTRALWQAMAASPTFTVIGGGDSIAAARRFGLLDRFSYVCTAGGGLVRFLAGEPLAVVHALAEAAARHAGDRSP